MPNNNSPMAIRHSLWRTCLYLCNRVVITLCMTCFSAHSTVAQAEDLIQTFNLAKQNDQAWLAERAKYRANRENEFIGRSGLLPQVNFSASHTNLRYGASNSNTNDASTVGNLLNLEIEEFFNCLFVTAVNSVFPSDQNNGILDICRQAAGPTSTDINVNEFTLSISQPLYRLERWYSYKRAKASSDQAYAEYLRAEQELILRVAGAYFNVLKAWEQIEFARKEEESIKKQLRLTQKRYQKGLATSSDVFEAQAVSDLKYSTRLSTESAFDTAIEDLERITNKPGIEILPLPDEIVVDSPVPQSTTAWIEAGKQENIDIIIARLYSSVSKQNHKARRAAHSPTFDLVASFAEQNSNGRTSAFDAGNTTTSSIGVNFNLPLYTGGALTARERQAKHQLREAEYQVERVTREVTSSIRNLYRSLEANVRLVGALRIAIDSNTKALNRVEVGYQKGARHIGDVLQAQRDLYKTKLDLANAKYEYVMDGLRLKRAAGVLTKADLATLNAWLGEQSMGDRPSPVQSQLPVLQHKKIDASSVPLHDTRDAYQPSSQLIFDDPVTPTPSASPTKVEKKKKPGRFKRFMQKIF